MDAETKPREKTTRERHKNARCYIKYILEVIPNETIVVRTLTPNL